MNDTTELGLKTSTLRLQAAEQKLIDRNNQLNEDNRIQEEHIEDRRKEIEAANWLNKNSVTGKDIINFRCEFKAVKKGLPELQGEFYELSKIPETLNKYDDRFKQLDKVELERKASNEQLEKKRLSLEAANKALDESYARRVKEIEDRVVKSMQDSVNHVEWVGAEVGRRAEKAVDDSAVRIEKRMDATGKTLSQRETSLKMAVDNAIGDVAAINAKAFGAGKATGAYEMLGILHRILSGENVDRITGATTILTTLRALESYLSQGAANSLAVIQNLQEYVKNELILR